MAESKGFIKIDKNITNNWVWNDEVFSKGQAWVDLLLNTQFKDGCFQSKKGRIEYKRGDCTFSLSDLSGRWGWSRWKVRTFLDILEEHEMIKRKMVKKKYSIITVLNYNKYQSGNAKSTNAKNSKNGDDFDYDKARAFLMGDDND